MYAALIYPNINLTNSKIVKESLLLYDNLYRIVPEDVIPQDNPDIEDFNREYGLIKEISPTPYTRDVYEKFSENLDRWTQNAYGISHLPESRLHKTKVYDELMKIIIREKILEFDGEWLRGNESFIGSYMLYLATEISTRNSLNLVTDEPSVWVCQEYMNYDGRLLNVETADDNVFNTHSMLGVYLYEYIPSNIDNITFDNIIEFRDKYRVERENFLKQYMKFYNELSKISSPIVLRDALESYLKEMKSGIEEYKNACRYFGAQRFVGLRLVSIPIISQISNLFLNLNPHMKQMLATLGLALSILWELTSYKQEVKRIRKNNPFSYLVLLKNLGFSNHQRIRNNIYNDMKELIYD
ncbi:MAG TPA: hypothetical protein ENI33_01595 [Thermoplasmatales archaeon]|nr:hypothetical protein [Thermoplasmatales archaeon]